MNQTINLPKLPLSDVDTPVLLAAIASAPFLQEPSRPQAVRPRQSAPTSFGFEEIMRRPRRGQFRAWYDRNSRLFHRF